VKAEIVAATAGHAAAIAANARQADIDELWAQARATPLAAMRIGLCHGAKTGLLDGVPVCMFGVTPHGADAGVPWMVTARGMESLSAQKRLLTASRAEFDAMKARYSMLFNVVDERNDAAKRWLAWLGFTLSDPVSYGPLGLPFRLFQWSKP
jgi:hypothetical protein